MAGHHFTSFWSFTSFEFRKDLKDSKDEKDLKVFFAMSESPGSPDKPTRRRANRLDGKRWIQNSISVWGDLRKTAEELRFKHPAMFPGQLVERLIDCFLAPEGQVVLDPFSGSGSTVCTAARMGLQGIGLEISPEYIQLSQQRLSELANPKVVIHQAPASQVRQFVQAESVDLCVTSPPYWNILNQRRTADFKAQRHYGNLPEDLGTIADYHEFLDALASVFQQVLSTLKPRAYCCVVVMDLRKRDQFYPFHSDLARKLQEVGYRFDDLIIWNRQAEYNNLRPLGYPSVFRINKVHEYVLLMQKTA